MRAGHELLDVALLKELSADWGLLLSAEGESEEEVSDFLPVGEEFGLIEGDGSLLIEPDVFAEDVLETREILKD